MQDRELLAQRQVLGGQGQAADDQGTQEVEESDNAVHIASWTNAWSKGSITQ